MADITMATPAASANYGKLVFLDKEGQRAQEYRINKKSVVLGRYVDVDFARGKVYQTVSEFILCTSHPISVKSRTTCGHACVCPFKLPALL